MLRRYEAELRFPTGERAVSAMGSILHGALMERLPADAAAVLHTQSLRPYRQSIRIERESGRVFWCIGTLTEAMDELAAAALGTTTELFLRQKGYAVSLHDFHCVSESTDTALADVFFLPARAPRGAELTFYAPTAFKRDGQYVLLPEMLLIVQSLLMRWGRFCPHVRMEEEDLAVQLAAGCQIRQYALHTATFSVDGHPLRGFCGSLTIGFTGTDSMRRILGMLMSFASYAGIGIKTALGMGAVEADVWKGRDG